MVAAGIFLMARISILCSNCGISAVTSCIYSIDFGNFCPLSMILRDLACSAISQLARAGNWYRNWSYKRCLISFDNTRFFKRGFLVQTVIHLPAPQSRTFVNGNLRGRCLSYFGLFGICSAALRLPFFSGYLFVKRRSIISSIRGADAQSSDVCAVPLTAVCVSFDYILQYSPLHVVFSTDRGTMRQSAFMNTLGA
jgi:hypothetical protein